MRGNNPDGWSTICTISFVSFVSLYKCPICTGDGEGRFRAHMECLNRIRAHVVCPADTNCVVSEYQYEKVFHVEKFCADESMINRQKQRCKILKISMCSVKACEKGCFPEFGKYIFLSPCFSIFLKSIS